MSSPQHPVTAEKNQKKGEDQVPNDVKEEQESAAQIKVKQLLYWCFPSSNEKLILRVKVYRLL